MKRIKTKFRNSIILRTFEENHEYRTDYTEWKYEKYGESVVLEQQLDSKAEVIILGIEDIEAMEESLIFLKNVKAQSVHKIQIRNMQ